MLWSVVPMSGGISLVVAVMWSRHAVDVQHGMTAKVVRSKVDHCRHWGRRDHKWMNRRGDPSTRESHLLPGESSHIYESG